MAFAILAIPSGFELFVVLGVILLLFGSTKLPKLARSLGSSVTEFKKGVKTGDTSSGDGDPEDPKVTSGSKDDGEQDDSADKKSD
jgi:sec-independent protein translocase protein TatA